MVERDLAKVEVAGSNPVSRSLKVKVLKLVSGLFAFITTQAGVVEQVDTQDLKSCGSKIPYGFDSRPRY